MIRAPSGKDLFKGREVGLMRRTGSRKEIMSVRQDSLPGPAGLGLLGRKTSDPKKTRVPEGTSTRFRSNADEQKHKADLL